METTNNTIVLSSDTETDDSSNDTDDDDDNDEEEEEGVEDASVSELVDSSSSGLREIEGSTSEATTPGTPLKPELPPMPDSSAYILNSTTDQSSVTSASQLSCDDTTAPSSAAATLGDSTISILTAELASHPAKLAEVVVEGVGEKDEEEKLLKERKRENSVSGGQGRGGAACSEEVPAGPEGQVWPPPAVEQD